MNLLRADGVCYRRKFLLVYPQYGVLFTLSLAHTLDPRVSVSVCVLPCKRSDAVLMPPMLASAVTVCPNSTALGRGGQSTWIFVRVTPLGHGTDKYASGISNTVIHLQAHTHIYPIAAHSPCPPFAISKVTSLASHAASDEGCLVPKHTVARVVYILFGISSPFTLIHRHHI